MSVLCLGLAVADVVASPLEDLPRPGTLRPVPPITLHTGGCAVNTGSALAKLGIKTSLIGAVGADGFGDFLRSELKTRGLHLQGLRTVKAATSASIVAVNHKGERSFTHHVGANAVLSSKDIDWSHLSKHKFLHIGGSFLMPKLDGKPLAAILKRAQSLGIKTSLDTVYNPKLNWAKVLKPCLPHLDYFLPSYEEARQISKTGDPARMTRIFQSLGAKAVAIKMGAKGSYIGAQVAPIRIKAVDTTGAGDAFCAGFLAGQLKGWSLLRSAQFGNVLGASCCTKMGAYDGIPNWSQALKLLKRHYRS